MSQPENTGGSGRDRKGRFVPGGGSGNPKGRPSTPREVLDYIGAHTLEAAERLVAIMRGKDAQQARLAAEALLDRRLGKPQQSLDVTARRGPDIGAAGGQPDAARSRLEALIAEAQATATVLQPVALPERVEPLPALGEVEAADVAKSWPSVPPEGTP